ncbi:MAG: ATP-binding cassette domain-containing protein [Bacillota bacterium]|nr:ATP-binding cassette domain-containing protein [Bacillota bacterium]
MKRVTIFAGHDKSNAPEGFEQIDLELGKLYTIVGSTGSGKSRLIKDIEQLADGDSVTGRRIAIDGDIIPRKDRRHRSAHLIAHLSQNMRFVLDTSVDEFIRLHAQCRNRDIAVEDILAATNRLTAEPVSGAHNLNQLSGGQTRALMIADIALLCDSPIVLIDEIENAGIDKEAALQLLLSRDKLVLVVTHDPHTALMAPKRIVMQGGAVTAVVERNEAETRLFDRLSQDYLRMRSMQQNLRQGVHLA